MEKDPNPFPKFDVIPGLGIGKLIAGTIIKWVSFLPQEPLAPHGDTLPTALRVEPEAVTLED